MDSASIFSNKLKPDALLSSVHTIRLISEIFVSDTNLTVCTALIHLL